MPLPQETRTHSLLFESFSDVPAEWHDVCRRDDLAMDTRALSVLQRTLADQCRCWGLIVFDASGTAIGCAALCAFRTEPIEPVPAAVLHLRRLWPNAGKIGVLFCGLPFPPGSTHLRVRDGAGADAVALEVDRVMRCLAQLTKSRLLVFKEFGASCAPLAAALAGLGYVRGAVPPMHVLEGAFASFADYRYALKSRYRAQIRRSEHKLRAAGFEIASGRGEAFLLRHFDEAAHLLYVSVQRRAKYRLELMPAAFFHGLAAALGDEALLTLIRRDGRTYAFTFAITRGGTHYNLYSGLDYAVNNEGDLYFNLFYRDMDQAFRAGARTLHLGQTSDTFKARLGSRTEKLHFFARAHPAALHPALKLASAAAFPQVSSVLPHDVFTRPAGEMKQRPCRMIAFPY